MADEPLSELIAPFRQSVQAFADAVALVRRVSGDEVYRRSLDSLQQLPSSSTFHPFDVTAQWSTDQAPASQVSAVTRSSQALAAHGRSQAATARQRLSVVNRSEPVPSQSVQSPEPIQGRPRAVIVAPQPSTAASGGQPPAAIAGGQPPPAIAGGWSALTQVARLLADIEAPAGRKAAPGAGIAQAIRQDDRIPLPRPTGVSQAATRAAIGAAVAGQTPAAPMSGSGKTPEQATAEQTTISLVADAVEALWQPATTIPASPATPHESSKPSTPAPRAASVLLASVAAAASQTVAESRTPPGEQARARASAAAPSAVPHDQEPLAEQVNRALIEQAWLRGVDLA